MGLQEGEGIKEKEGVGKGRVGKVKEVGVNFDDLIACRLCCLIRFGGASVKRIVDWLTKCNLVSTGSSILDVGCGNGITLVKLVSKSA